LNILEKTKAKYREYEDRHKQILKAAIRLFNESGYHATTTASIALEAGVHEPTMYKHFSKKRELYMACFQSIVDQLSTKYRSAYKENKDDVIAYISSVNKIYLDFVEQNPHKSMLPIHLLSNRNDPLFFQMFKDFMEKNIEAVERVLTSASKKKKIKLKSISQHDIRLLASLFVCQFFSVVAVRDFVESESLNSDTILNSMIGMLQLSGK